MTARQKDTTHSIKNENRNTVTEASLFRPRLFDLAIPCLRPRCIKIDGNPTLLQLAGCWSIKHKWKSPSLGEMRNSWHAVCMRVNQDHKIRIKLLRLKGKGMEVLKPIQPAHPSRSDRPGMVSGVARLQGLPLGTMWKGRALVLNKLSIKMYPCIPRWTQPGPRKHI